MIYTHVLNRGGFSVRSPAEHALGEGRRRTAELAGRPAGPIFRWRGLA